MFSDIEADIYIMVDGDDTYDASAVHRLIDELRSGPYDMVNAARVAENSGAYRSGHAWGNKLLTGLVQRIFGTATTDMLSGYKAFSRRYVKTFPTMSRGFEIETELVVHALDLRLPLSEISAPYKERPVGSESKLRTYSDGFRILRLIGFLVKEERPLAFFSFIAGGLAVLSLAIGSSVLIEFLETGLVPRLPTAVLATGMMLSALLSLSCGFILDTVTRGRREMKRLAYLQFAAPMTPRQQGRDSEIWRLIGKFPQFLGVGAIGFLIDACVFFGLTAGLSVAYGWARVAASLVALTATWLMNRNSTFADGRIDRAPVEFLRYLAASLAGAGANLATLATIAPYDQATAPHPGLCGRSGRRTGREFLPLRQVRLSRPRRPPPDTSTASGERPMSSKPEGQDNIDSVYYRDGVDKSLAMRILKAARMSMLNLFMREMTPTASTRILDIGVSDDENEGANFLEKHYPWQENITCAGIGSGEAVVAAYPKVSFQHIVPGERLPFADGAFDIACSNAVIEHVGGQRAAHGLHRRASAGGEGRLHHLPQPLVSGRASYEPAAAAL